jgi:hypothetical protein
MALGSSQPLTEMSTKNLPGLSAHKADNLTAICKQMGYKTWEPRLLTLLWASMSSSKDTFNVIFLF